MGGNGMSNVALEMLQVEWKSIITFQWRRSRGGDQVLARGGARVMLKQSDIGIWRLVRLRATAPAWYTSAHKHTSAMSQSTHLHTHILQSAREAQKVRISE